MSLDAYLKSAISRVKGKASKETSVLVHLLSYSNTINILTRGWISLLSCSVEQGCVDVATDVCQLLLILQYHQKGT